MDILVRDAIDSDRERCLWIEKYALPNVIYLNDVWEKFTSKTDGYLLIAEKDGEVGGFGKITKLFDDVGWLETLRIHPDYQGQGLGNAIYIEYLKRAKELGLNKVGLFTEWDNYRSENLAKKYGFVKMGDYADYSIPVSDVDNYQGNFKLVSTSQGEAIVSKYYDKINRFLIVNKTFFPMITGVGQDLAEREWVYQDDDNNFVIMGYRMTPHKAFFLGYYDGDFKKIMEFVNHKALEVKAGRISAQRDKNDASVAELKANGFKNVEDFMCLYNNLEI